MIADGGERENCGRWGLRASRWRGRWRRCCRAGRGDPREVAAAIVKLSETPMGQRPLRTVVDAHPVAIHPVCAQVQAGLLGAMQLGLMLEVTPRSSAS